MHFFSGFDGSADGEPQKAKGLYDSVAVLWLAANQRRGYSEMATGEAHKTTAPACLNLKITNK